jgi:CDC45-like protein
LLKSVEVAINYQTSIVREARRIIEDKKVKAVSQFRYCILTSQYFEQHFTPNYLSLQKLASLMIEIYGVVSTWKPMAICVLDTVADLYNVVGVMPTTGKSNVSKQKNFFGNQFLIAAEQAKVRHTRDFFDSAMIQVQKEDFMNFLNKLIKLQ